MGELRLRARLYIGFFALTAVGSTLAGLGYTRPLSLDRVALAFAFATLFCVAHLFPLRIASKTKVTLGTSVIFVSILLFEPAVAMLIVGSGALLANVIRRRPPDEMLFNTSQAMLQAGVGGLLLTLVDWNRGELRFDRPDQLVMILVAAVAMYTVNNLSLATMVGLQLSQSPLLVWRQSKGLDTMERLAQLALGLLAAAVIDAHVWALPFLLLPAVAVYSSLERHIQLRRQTLEAVESLADIVDIRDPYTADHSKRVAAYARALAVELGLTPDEANLVEQAARVHDIGKIVVDINVLTKEGRLTAAEWEQLKRHPVTGVQILSRFPQFSLATSYVRHHHERVDGGGYPDGLAGDDIPLGARIIAVADSFDAMSTARPYRPALPLDTVLAELVRHRGRQWDERVVDALLRLVEREQIQVPGTSTVRHVHRIAI
ncbi:MAG: HD-GYP domain-containing protein [Chloroflexota bacterium]|nr:HD-GYP domain-containing protein [Chloroflexota bacterium]